LSIGSYSTKTFEVFDLSTFINTNNDGDAFTVLDGDCNDNDPAIYPEHRNPVMASTTTVMELMRAS
jgi:hypothetical protein